MRNLANAQWDRPASMVTSGRLFLSFGGPTILAIVHWIGCINAIKKSLQKLQKSIKLHQFSAPVLQFLLIKDKKVNIIFQSIRFLAFFYLK